MKTVMSRKLELAERELLRDALEIAKDDPEIRSADFQGFCAIMWPDDHDMKSRGLSRDEYQQALRDAWQLFETEMAARRAMTLNDKLDEQDREILNERIAAFNERKGPRVGDFVIMLDGVYRRFTHCWGEKIQTTSSLSNADAGRGGGASFYLGYDGMGYSGGLDPAIPKSKLALTDEVREGHAWFFHHDCARAHNGVEVKVPCRVYRQVS